MDPERSRQGLKELALTFVIKVFLSVWVRLKQHNVTPTSSLGLTFEVENLKAMLIVRWIITSVTHFTQVIPQRFMDPSPAMLETWFYITYIIVVILLVLKGLGS